MIATEIRRDPITGRTVVIERGSAKRRDDFDIEPVGLGDAAEACPLCEGHEEAAGPEIAAWRDEGPANGPGWSVRVVANRNPQLRIEGGIDIHREGLFEWRDGLGAHEVIVETPRHDQPLHALDAEALWRVLWAWRTRMQDLKRDTRFVSIVIFKNHGRAAGARLDHAHSQLKAYPVVPPALAEKVRGSVAYHEEHGRCIGCDLIAAEARDGRRIICEEEGVIAYAPFASRLPFEAWLLPRDHAPRFEDASDRLLESLAAALRTVMSGIDWALEGPAYNLVLHSGPLTGEADAAFHWHVEVLPRVTRYSGQEWGSGMHRNPVAPEEAARILRNRLV